MGDERVISIFEAAFTGLIFGICGLLGSWWIVDFDRAALYALVFGAGGAVFCWTGGALGRLALAYWGRSPEPAKPRITRLLDPRRNGAALETARQGRLKP